MKFNMSYTVGQYNVQYIIFNNYPNTTMDKKVQRHIKTAKPDSDDEKHIKKQVKGRKAEKGEKEEKVEKGEKEEKVEKGEREEKVEKDPRDIMSILSHFGNPMIEKEPQTPSHIVINYGMTKQISMDQITMTIRSMMDGKYQHINMMLIEICLKQFINDQVTDLLTHIYKILSEITQEQVIALEKQMEDKTFSLEEFLSFRTKYFISTAKLGTVFRSLIDTVKMKKNNVMKIIRDYVFYQCVLNHQYQINGQKKYLFSILIDMVEKNNVNSVKDLFKIVNTYNGFSHSIKFKKNRSQIFNPMIDSLGQNAILDDKLMIDYCVLINEEIVKLCRSTDNDEKKRLIDRIIECIYMTQRIGNPQLFMKQYHEHLQIRLLDQMDERQLHHNVLIESTLIKLLKESNSPETYGLINFAINDILAVELINNEFRNLTVRFQSDEYEKDFQNIFDRKIVNALVLRQLSWDQVMKKRSTMIRINEPQIIKNYLNIFEKFYSHFFTNRMSKYTCRDITYNYECSTVEMDLQIRDKTYHLKLNFIQACILNYIVDNENISAEDLSTKMNMRLAMMNLDINALLLSKIIKRDAIQPDDISMRFIVNLDFHISQDQYDVDVMSYVEDAKKLFHQMVNGHEPEKNMMQLQHDTIPQDDEQLNHDVDEMMEAIEREMMEQ